MVGVPGGVAFYLGLAVVSTAVIWSGSGRLERSAEQLSRHYGLPAAVHGAVVVAIGSSFPELSSVVVSTLRHDEFSLGVGAIVGSAIFNLLVIPGVSALASGRLEATRDVVHKDAQFYVISILVLFLVFALGATSVPGGTNEAAVLTPALALIPLATYAVYVFLLYQDTRDHVAAEVDVDVPRKVGVPVVALLLIGVGVEGIVRAALGFGEIFGTPSFLWGLTVSPPRRVSRTPSSASAQRGRTRTSPASRTSSGATRSTCSSPSRSASSWPGRPQ
jgi:cation:H+ antiporter